MLGTALSLLHKGEDPQGTLGPGASLSLCTHTAKAFLLLERVCRGEGSSTACLWCTTASGAFCARQQARAEVLFPV